MLSLVLAESAVEVIPQSLWKRLKRKKQSKSRTKKSKLSILSQSYHHEEMKSLRENWKRGRPDIVHSSLLQALGSPLNLSGLLRTYVHTIKDYVISIDSSTRLPRNYLRFIGLIEDLFEYGRVPKTGNSLLRLEKKSISSLLMDIKPSYTIAFSQTGRLEVLDELMPRFSSKKNLALIIGGFQAGTFRDTTIEHVDDLVCINPHALDASIVVGRAIYEYERAISLA